MNIRMFKNIISQTDVKVDFSSSIICDPNTIKFVKLGETYRVFKIDKSLNKTLIVETTSINTACKATLKFLDIKINNSGKVLNNKRR